MEVGGFKLKHYICVQFQHRLLLATHLFNTLIKSVVMIDRSGHRRSALRLHVNACPTINTCNIANATIGLSVSITHTCKYKPRKRELVRSRD